MVRSQHHRWIGWCCTFDCLLLRVVRTNEPTTVGGQRWEGDSFARNELEVFLQYRSQIAMAVDEFGVCGGKGCGDLFVGARKHASNQPVTAV